MGTIPFPGHRVDDPAKAEEIERYAFVKSYDFESRDDCYVVGRVMHTDRSIGGCYRYEILALKRVFDGKELPYEPGEERTIFPPRNGTRVAGSDTYTNGVRALPEDDQEFWREKWSDWASDYDVGGE